MGKKYESGVSYGSVVRNRLKFLIPASILLVFVVWNSSSLSPFDAASNGPVSYTILSDQDHHNVQDGRHEMSKTEAEAIAAQYENLRSTTPSLRKPDETYEDEFEKETVEETPVRSEQSEVTPAISEEASPAEIEVEETPVLSEQAPGESEKIQVAPAQTDVLEEAPAETVKSVEAPALTEGSKEAPVVAEDSVERPAQTQDAPLKTEEAPRQTEAVPVESEVVSPKTLVAPSQADLSNLENVRQEATRNPDSGKTEEEEDAAPVVKRMEEDEEFSRTVEEVETVADEENPLGIDPERLPLILGNKTHLAGTDEWKLGPLGSDLKYMEESIRATMLPYVTRKPTNSVEETCEGKYVYVYDLPAEYNKDLVGRCDSLFSWFSMCPYVVDSGRGLPVNAVDNGTQIFVPGNKWFNTHQYALEMISHARILKYKCRTEDREKANLFYIPFYAGLDVIQWHFDPNTTKEKKDALSLKLMSWLVKQKEFVRRQGKDHVLVLGKISWDFRRQPDAFWGSRMLQFPELKEVTRLMIERDPWSDHDIGVPHPTYFHPTSASDIDAWLAHIKSQKREYLVTFVGKERKNDPTNPRTALVRQCMNVTSAEDCRFVECNKDKCLHAAFVTRAFLATHFCMQPPGDSPTRRSVFDSLIAGCIPVLFHPQTAYTQYPWHLPRNESLYSVYIPEEEVIKGTVNVVDELKKISVEQRNAMREYIITTMIPGLIYSEPGADVSPYRDAFEISLDQVLHRTKLSLDQSQ
ncbi:hypothetical protein KC19_2G110000 [Ceratodon purpureus]|uniref:Exostosin GT47 domain-containing protein n=2 Tax=Ceratodon purpureus TaxID=3225 RepID=A0A8T0IU76_CERPU|nr:hypothetical protein KC19_2G110000 [Ceratodon purpureus]KAG0586698.1 hypothetical protein KC19_2G110000 [Ceratodon purpureus]